MKKIARLPFFLLLLPVFFMLHTLTEHYIPVLIGVSMQLILLYTGAGLAITCLSWLILRHWNKAALVAFALLSFNFFFGSAHDFLRKHFHGTFFIKYTFILPALLVATIIGIIYLKKTNRSFNRGRQLLNLILVILIAIDLFALLPKAFAHKNDQVSNLQSSFTTCDTCATPDVYLIVADEYAGKQELMDIFGMDNSAFEQDLRNRGFYVVNNPVSNYNATVYSMASIFSMDYLHHLRDTVVNHHDMLICRGLIQHNNLLSFFKKRGYSISNQSYFEFDDKPKLVYNPFYPTKTALFTAQTFTHRLMSNIGFHFFGPKSVEKVIRHHYYNNKTIDSTTRNLVMQPSAKPRLVYTHLAMPHHPYYFDSTGKEATVEQLNNDFTSDKNGYIGYLKYANKKLLDLIDHIRAHTPKPPVIILMSDHGFRQFRTTVDEKYYFMNFNAVFLPSGNYSGFYDGMSNVNQFRVILNNQFGQRLPILKDSTTFYTEPQRDF